MRVRIDLQLEMDAGQFADLVNVLRQDGSASATFGGGQHTITANQALQAFVEALRKQVKDR